MTPRVWILGAGLVAAALIVHALVPRYEIQMLPTRAGVVFYVKVDRWTGRATRERF